MPGGSLVVSLAEAAPRVERRPARVLIVDDHPVLRSVVRAACEGSPGLEVVAEAEGGPQALDAVERFRPDVLVLELALPGIDGLEVTRRVKAKGARTKVLVLTGRTDDQTLFDCVRAGADGYIGKTSGVRFIAGAVEAVAAGRRVFTPEQERGAIAELRHLARQARAASVVITNLTERESEILRQISDGLTMKQVAKRLGLSPRTVESHIANLYRKLGARTRVQAVGRAASLGLIDLR